MNRAVLDFIGECLKDRSVVERKSVLEVGSLNINGTPRTEVLPLSPASYLGIDITEGEGVDKICNVNSLVKEFGEGSFDLVISTEMIEHIQDWKNAVVQMKRAVRVGGYLLITTRSPGFPHHGFPVDCWRFTELDFRKIFKDMKVCKICPDPSEPGVFGFFQKKANVDEALLNSIEVASAPLDRARGEVEIVRDFHELWFSKAGQGGTWLNLSWMGVEAQKNPFDMWIYQEIIHEVSPDLIIECGTCKGGSALFLANMCDIMGKGNVISIDIEKKDKLPVHPRILYLTGSSADEKIFNEVKGWVRPKDVVMVILDSDHRKDHVLRELELYSTLVSKGSYLIVEDGNINGNPVIPNFGPGPNEAISEFMSRRQDFYIDQGREKLLLTFNPRGYLRKL